MDNPFLRRATEQFRRDNEAFLAVVSPEPITHFLSTYAKENQLYDRLAIIQGTPGSGKTTLAQLFEYPTLAALLRNPDSFRPLLAAMVTCRAIENRKPRLVGCRLSLETDYRDFWEFGYTNEIKLGLMTALIQARAVQAWIQNLHSSGIARERISIVPRSDALAATSMIGGTAAIDIEKKAQAVELSLYRIVAALVPPEIADLDANITEAYRPFDVIERFRIAEQNDNEEYLDLLPLVILDDAHLLHPTQFQGLRRWLTRRELRTARWMMTRLDILQPEEALATITEERGDHAPLPGITKQRDMIDIFLQGGRERGKQRIAFRRMARDMSNRYLQKMSVFNDRNLQSLPDLLSPNPSTIAPSKLKDLVANVTALQKRLDISVENRAMLVKQIEQYKPDGRETTEDERQQMLSILMCRFVKRPIQSGLFDVEPANLTQKPTRSLNVDSNILEASCIALCHKYGRPLYFGMDDLCDASSENAEQFLHLAAILVEEAAVKVIRSRPASLDANTQHDLLTQRAGEIIRDWNFPQHRLVRRFIEYVAAKCLEQTLTPNAWNAPGANAYGIPQSEFESVALSYPDLASVLQFGVAYNAISLVPNYSCKNRKWCLFELGGLAILQHGLTLRRGGFVEGTAEEIVAIIAEYAA